MDEMIGYIELAKSITAVACNDYVDALIVSEQGWLTPKNKNDREKRAERRAAKIEKKEQKLKERAKIVDALDEKDDKKIENIYSSIERHEDIIKRLYDKIDAINESKRKRADKIADTKLEIDSLRNAQDELDFLADMTIKQCEAFFRGGSFDIYNPGVDGVELMYKLQDFVYSQDEAIEAKKQEKYERYSEQFETLFK